MDAGGERVVLGAFVMNALLAGANSVGIRFSNASSTRCGGPVFVSRSPRS
jgi:hypothetical protein